MLGFLQRAKPVENLLYRSGIRYYLKMAGQSEGPYTMDQLRRLRGFTLQSPLRLGLGDEWEPAFTVLDLKAYMTPPSLPNEWSQAAARSEKERARQAAKAKWRLRKEKIVRFLRRLAYWTFGFSFVVATGYAASTGRIQPQLWRERLAILGHQKIQWSIRGLQDLDARYFLPKSAPAKPKPTVIRTMIPPKAAKASTPPHRSAKPGNIVSTHKRRVR